MINPKDLQELNEVALVEDRERRDRAASVRGLEVAIADARQQVSRHLAAGERDLAVAWSRELNRLMEFRRQ